MQSYKDLVYSYFMAFIVGDVMGVPYEFLSKDDIKNNLCSGEFVSGGFHRQPMGSWSDDTSLALATMQGIKSDCIDFDKIMDNFCSWYKYGKYTSNGYVFDIGVTTKNSLFRYINGEDVSTCGEDGENSNGNGSLMRIAPLFFFLRKKFGDEFMKNEESFSYIYKLSGLTHRHMRSVIACGIYLSLMNEIVNSQSIIMDDKFKKQAIIKNAITKVRQLKPFGISDEIEQFDDFDDIEWLSKLNIATIKGQGYVLDSLLLSIACFLQYDDTFAAMKDVINLVAYDTDTNAAIVSGLLNLYSQSNEIEKLFQQIPSKEKLSKILTRFSNVLDIQTS